jgi:hypothetical protein
VICRSLRGSRERQAFVEQMLTDFEVSLLGNSNRGHSFEGEETDVRKLPSGIIGPELTDDERRSLVEYLKTL